MSESYGYFSYGDIKEKVSIGEASFGIQNSSEINKHIIFKTTNCFSKSYMKSVNTSSDNSNESSQNILNVNKIDTKTISLDENKFVPDFYYFEVEGELKTWNIKIEYTPSDAIVKINNELISEYTAFDTENIKWEVSAEGYVAQSGILMAKKDETLKINLRPIEYYSLEIIPTPSNAEVYINDEETNKLVVPEYTLCNYNVSAVNYIPYSGSELIERANKTLKITLEEEKPTYFIYTGDPVKDRVSLSLPNKSYAPNSAENMYAGQRIYTTNSNIMSTENIILSIYFVRRFYITKLVYYMHHANTGSFSIKCYDGGTRRINESYGISNTTTTITKTWGNSQYAINSMDISVGRHTNETSDYTYVQLRQIEGIYIY